MANGRDPGLDNLIDPRLLSLGGARRTSKLSSSNNPTNATNLNTRDLTQKRKSLAQSYQELRNSIRPASGLSIAPQYTDDTIVLDIGGRFTKAGFIGEPAPRIICDTKLYLGDIRISNPFPHQTFKEGAKLLPVILSVSRVQLSAQTWDEIARMLIDDLLFRQLMIKPNTRRVMVLTDPFWPKLFQNGLAKALFKHDVPGVQFIDSLYAATFCTGGDTALVLDVGYHTSKLTATFMGHTVSESRLWIPVGFNAIATNFKKLIKETTSLDLDRRDFQVEAEDVEAPIARTCFVAPNRDQTPADSKANSISYEFRVKKQSAFCKIGGNVRHQACDALFDEANRINIAHFVCDTLLKIPVDCRAKLINNILLTGGTVCMPGFSVRFINEMKYALTLDKYSALKKLSKYVRLIECEFPANIRMFVGGSIYGQLTERYSDDLFITKEDFESEKKYNGQIPDSSDPKYPLITQEQMVRKHGPTPRAQGFRKAKDILSNQRTSLTGNGVSAETPRSSSEQRSSLTGLASRGTAGLRDKLQQMKAQRQTGGFASPQLSSIKDEGLDEISSPLTTQSATTTPRLASPTSLEKPDTGALSRVNKLQERMAAFRAARQSGGVAGSGGSGGVGGSPDAGGDNQKQ